MEKYVFVMCSSTNIDRIMGIWQNMPTDKVLICDAYQKRILDTVLIMYIMKVLCIVDMIAH